MPISSTAATVEKKKSFRLHNQVKSIDQNDKHVEKNLLKIAPALPAKDKRSLYVRSHSTLNASALSKVQNEHPTFSESVQLRTHTDGLLHISRLQEEKEAHPDRISLDKRGLVSIPIINGEPKLRLLSLQHNLINSLEMLGKQSFPTLVFLDMYDNQLERLHFIDKLENLRVLLLGKNRIKKIEGLEKLLKMEVLDFHGNQITQVEGLSNLKELKAEKLLGFGEVPNLVKLFASNNDIQCVEDMSSLAKSQNIKEISIDNNPISLAGDCVSFLVSYLPHLIKLNSMQITEQVRKAAMAWRRNKEATNVTFMDLTSDVSLTCRRDEVISNARTNWELLRSQTKCLTTSVNIVEKTVKNLKPDSDFILTPLRKMNSSQPVRPVKSKAYMSQATKVPVLADKKLNLLRTSSQDTENSQNTSSSNASGNEFFKLPPILVPIINKLGEKFEEQAKEGSPSSVGPNVDSSVSSFASGSDIDPSASCYSSCSSKESDSDSEPDAGRAKEEDDPKVKSSIPTTTPVLGYIPAKNSIGIADSSSWRNFEQMFDEECQKRRTRKIHTAAMQRQSLYSQSEETGLTGVPKDREQGGDYLIEICGRHLNVYGQGALRFIDKPWNASKAHDVNTVKFNYVNFNSVTGVLGKLKHRFPNVENFAFKETNITCLGQLNALAEIQGLASLHIDPEGNPICEKDWQSYAVYRLAHWGLKTINNKEVTEDEIKQANEEYQSLSDLILWSLPDVLLQPLLVRLRIDINHGVSEQNAKKWLLSADPELKSVVSKEALQWKKSSISQEDAAMRQKAKQYITGLLEEMANAMNKLVILDEEWPTILHNFVQNTLLDYSQLDLYMKQKIQELNK
ncbi:hypothetical protein JTB14_016171 [Gonioctena quinquepunctata]|nr:hypothetical protein JTB14_016171 [Gonioctena quinquepunctata]